MAIIITGGTNNAVVAAVTGGRHAICQRRLQKRTSFIDQLDTNVRGRIRGAVIGL